MASILSQPQYVKKIVDNFSYQAFIPGLSQRVEFGAAASSPCEIRELEQVEDEACVVISWASIARRIVLITVFVFG